ncbi:hypothetical protein EJD97_012181 [Solanum chilense]|uniref:Uncharacterized protein n=1 Tax=Solanum chilense TaxID=4083 RepID=A0A6N2BMC4_SOLCI|nr:hypothetical protein EJD97_012181 [Solanum chilense]
MSVAAEKLIVLETENLELKKKLKMLSEKSGKEKGEAISIQMELEASLNSAETKLTMALEINYQLERDLVHVKEELNKYLKWATSLKLLANLTSQGQNYRQGLGNSSKNPSYNLHGKDVLMSNIFSCLHCGCDGQLKKDCLSLKKTQENRSKYSNQRNRKTKGPGQQNNKRNKGTGQIPARRRSELFNIGAIRRRDLVKRRISRRRDLVNRRIGRRRDLVVLLFLS